MNGDRSVLLVDDVAALRMLLRVALETVGGFEVVGEAGDGESAVTEAGALQPEVILLDLSMPKMDGLEALPKIKVASPDSNVIILTGFDLERINKEAIELGALGCIRKGMGPIELMDEMVKMLDGA